MSFIDHNCECGHPVIMHTPREKNGVVCHCGCTTSQHTESVLIETMDDHGERMPLTAPGTPVPLPPPRLVACDCEQCVALYEEVSA